MEAQDIRWKQRFANFLKAHNLLAELYHREIADLNIYECESYIHRFTLVFDLSWKTLNDYLQFQGINSTFTTPRAIIKEAFSAQVIQDGQIFIDMLLARNELTHVYDEKRANEFLVKIKSEFLPAVTGLIKYFEEQL